MQIAAISDTMMAYSTIVAPSSSPRTSLSVFVNIGDDLQAGVNGRESVADALTEAGYDYDADRGDERDHDTVLDHRGPVIIAENIFDRGNH
jgi:hypothetical protein